MSTPKLTREGKVVLWVIGALTQMSDWGLITDGQYTVTAKGVSIWDQINEDFKPTDEDIHWVCSELECDEDIEMMVRQFRDNRGKMEKWVEENVDGK